MITVSDERYASIVWGIPDNAFLIRDAEIENLSSDCIAFKIKLRPKREGVAFIKTPNKITEFVIGFENGKIKLLIERGSNIMK